MKNSILIGTTDIRVRSETTRRKQKLTAGTVKMYVLYIFTYVFAAQKHRHPWQVQKLTSLSIFEREFLLCKNVAIAWNHGHPCPF